MNKSVIAGIAVFSFAAFAAGAAEPRTGTKSFKWVDKQGVTHYGDTIPPEYAQGHSAELNRQGVEVKRYPAQLSPDEAVKAETLAETLARNQQHDNFLLTTYTSTREIEQLRDERLAQIEGQVIAARGYIESVDKRLALLKTRAMNFKPYSKAPTARRMPDPLAEELVRAVNEGRAQQVVLTTKQAEQREMRAKFQADIDRYQVLIANRKNP